MTTDPRIKVGSVVQIAPDESNPGLFGGCMLIVSELKSWGVQGYVRIPGKGDSYCRPRWEQMAYVGESAWGRSDEEADKP